MVSAAVGALRNWKLDMHFATRFPGSERMIHSFYSKGGSHAVAVSNPLGVFTQKCVVEDRRGQADGCAAAAHSVATENPALAEDGAVLLAGNLLRHLKNHLNQRVLG